MPLKDDGLYRGDGAFEVIRLYAGQPFALADHLDRLQRSAATIELEFDRAALEAEIEALLTKFGEGDGQLRLIVTRGGRRIASTEPIPPTPRASASQPSPTRRASSSTGSSRSPMPPTCRRPGSPRRGAPMRRCWSAPTAPCSSRRPLRSSGSRLRATPCAHGARRACPRVDHPRQADPGAPRRGGRMADRRPSGRRRGVPRLHHARDPGGRRDRRPGLADAPGPRTREAQAAFAQALGREL